jgi:hypothetical protein
MTTLADYVRRFTRRNQRPLECSACGSPKSAERRFLSGPSCYICEPCVRETVARGPAADAHGLCSLCADSTKAAVRSWPKISICADCLDLAQDIFDESHTI